MSQDDDEREFHRNVVEVSPVPVAIYDAEAHGWSVRVTESAEGGARFEFTGIEAV